MDARLAAVVPAPPAAVMPVVADLATYPAWLSVVRACQPVEGGWLVDIGARVGPVTPTKRLRMQPAPAAEGEVAFERHELDGEEHPAWVLRVSVAGGPEPGTTELGVHLHYSGAPSLPFVEAVLGGESRRAAARLGELASRRAD